MKLKKVTALLLATSMVLSSVSVASFADELVFEEEVVSTEDNAGEVVSFDEVAFEDDTAEDEEDSVEDVFTEDDGVIDEVVTADDSALEEVAEEQPTEEPADPNADIYEAIGGGSEIVSEEVVDEQKVSSETYFATTQVEDVTAEYDGQPHKLDYEKVGIKKGEIRFKTGSTYTFDEPSVTKVADSKSVSYQVLESLEPETWSDDYSATITVTRKPVTATLKTTTYTFGDTSVAALSVNSFNFDGLVSGESASSVLKLTADYGWDDVKFYKETVGGWSSTAEAAVNKPSELNAGTYKAVFENAFKNDEGNYTTTAPECMVVVAKKKVTAKWDEKTKKSTYDGNSKTHTASGAPTGYTFVYSNNTKTDAGKYTAEITGMTRSGTDVSSNFEIENSKDEFEILKATAYVRAKDVVATTIEYGSKDPASAFTANDVIKGYYSDKEGKTSVSVGTVSGTPLFETTYLQGDDIGLYYVDYKSGLSTKNYELVQTPHEKGKYEGGVFAVTQAKVKIVPTNVTVPSGKDPVEPKYTFADVTLNSGAAKALENDIANKKVALSVFVTETKGGTTPATPVIPGTYYYGFTLSNYDASRAAYDPSYKPADNFTVTIDQDRTYTVTKTDISLSFEDYEGVYDGQPHGIIVTPDPDTLPKDVKIHYSRTYSSSKTTKEAWPTEPIVEIDPVNKSTVYYYVDSTDNKNNKTVITEGWNTITIISEDDYAVKVVEDAIAEATKKDASGNYDPEKVAAARAAYDSLTPEQKQKVSPYALKALEEAEAAIGPVDDKKAAKAVENMIDALPAAADATAATKPAADAAKAAYDALTDAEKALVPADKVQKLNDVKAAADKAAEDDEKAEREREMFDQLVAAVKAQKNGVDGKAAAEAAKEAYENLSPAAIAKLTEEELLAYDKTQDAYKKDKTFESGEGVFKVLSNGEVTYLKPLHPENTWFVVPNQVKKNGFMYKVIKVSTKAFMGCINATKIKIGKNVQTMGSYAFKNTPAMNKLIFLTSKLGSGKVTNTFVGGGKQKGAKLTVVCPNGKSSTYEPIFVGEGGLNAKAKFTEED
jgi:hypothetical protein